MTKVLFVVTIGLLLTSCGMSAEEQEKAKNLEQKYNDAFITRAKEQYGEETKVEKIRADRTTKYDVIGFNSSDYTNGYLKGNVITDQEKFETIYHPEENIIYSKRNYKMITKSVKGFLGLSKIEILDTGINDSAHEIYYLPDEITTFEQMLTEKYFMQVFIYTTSDISRYNESDFKQLKKYYDLCDGKNGYVVLVQLGQEDMLSGIQKDIHNISFEYKSPGKVYDNEKKKYVNAFDKYKIVRSIYITKDGYVEQESK